MTFDYINYWEQTYKTGGNSGSGSYGVLAEFKAAVVNACIERYNVNEVIEFGCGDGHQLGLINYPRYIGLDISSESVRICQEKYGDDPTKAFATYHPLTWTGGQQGLQADMTVCLDVLYHIIDENHFQATLSHVLNASRDIVVIYSKLDTGDDEQIIYTIKDRDLLSRLAQFGDFQIVERIPQLYPDISSASFVILRRKSAIA
ncbi:methyltransferase [Paenibacillus sp. GCM10012306]|uniref:methyltransferase n=1 Tax=Paenibacillus sp. GCM10012306 TaxID=3317342 RepID=UPI00361447EA